MATSSLTTDFEELEDSPKFKISRGEHSCTRRFIMSWAYIPSFIDNLVDDGPGGIPQAVPALLLNSYVSSIEAVPYSSDNAPDGQVITNPSTAMNTYTGGGFKKQALVTVTYEIDHYNRQWPTSIPKPNTSTMPHTCLRLSVRTSGQFLTIPGRGAKWTGPILGATGSSSASETDNDRPLPPDIGNRILIMVQDLKVEWYYLKRTLDTNIFDYMVGHANTTSFLGGVPETVLFDSYDVDEDIGLNPEDPYRYKVTLNFRKRIKNIGGFSSGSAKYVTWNHDYREFVRGNPGGWTRVVMTDGKPRYELAELSSMFLTVGG